MPVITTKQLRVADQAGDSLRQNLRAGVFSVILEYTVPPATQPLLMGVEAGVELMKFAAAEKRLTALAVAEGFTCDLSYDLLAVVQLLRKAGRKKELIAAVAGRGLAPAALSEMLTGLAAQKVGTVTVHTGAALPDHPRDPRGRPLPAPGDYLDSCRLLRLVRQGWPAVHLGARLNPAKYALADAQVQYHLLVRQLASGAEFVVAQAGWDLRKLHELQWYLRRRSLDEPVIARLLFLKPGEIARILAHEYPGMTMSRELAARLQRAEADPVAALDQQLRRTCLQAVGCRLLGYSGVQLAGVPDALTARILVDRLFACFAELQQYDAWLEAWRDFSHQVETAPFRDSYYMFPDLLAPGRLDYDEAAPVNPAVLDPPGASTRWRYRLAVGLGLDRRRNPLWRPCQRLLCGWRPGYDWHLGRTAMQCAAGCPKGLEGGPCNESRPDGTCEFGHRPCFYHDVLRVCQWARRVSLLEEADAD